MKLLFVLFCTAAKRAQLCALFCRLPVILKKDKVKYMPNLTKHKKITIVLCCVLGAVIVILAVVWARFGYRAQSYSSTSYAMGTYIQQTVYGKEAQSAASAGSQAVTSLEDKISWRVQDSDIANLNDASGTVWKTLDSYTISLLQMSQKLAQQTDGAFDPTVLPLTSLWDFDGKKHVPTAAELKNALSHVGYQNLRLNTSDNTASLKMHYNGVDLGAVGKGAACDKVLEAYSKKNITAAVVAVGGSIGLYGNKPDNSGWSVAVRDPKTSDSDTGSVGTIALQGGQFVSTSGTYEKEFTANGKTYHHLLNPKTGMPQNNGLVSVTVVCKNGALSDALSTACYVLGKDKGTALAKSYGAETIYIDTAGNVTVSSGLKDSFQLTNTSSYRLAK
jgi:thiamine biosynthesis lipoprotein